MQQFGLAIDALAYRLRGHAIDDWGSVSWKAILSIVKDNLALSGKKKRLVKIGEARHYAAHYRAKVCLVCDRHLSIDQQQWVLVLSNRTLDRTLDPTSD